MEKERGRITKVREELRLFSYTYCKMAWSRSRGEELNKRPHHINSGDIVFTKMLIIEVRWGSHTHCITGFALISSWSYMYVKRRGLWNRRHLWNLKKYVRNCYTLDNDDALFEESESSNHNKSNDECHSQWWWCYGILLPVETFTALPFFE